MLTGGGGGGDTLMDTKNDDENHQYQNNNDNKAEDGQLWTCKSCTYKNEMILNTCEMCYHEREVHSNKETARVKSENFDRYLAVFSSEITENTEPFDCAICMDDNLGPREGVVLKECLHIFCK